MEKGIKIILQAKFKVILEQFTTLSGFLLTRCSSTNDIAVHNRMVQNLNSVPCKIR